ncbi:sterol desaturase family protein [Thorsellia anophelis]|uniref:Sterol desaturase/sphingolipid hydroxylase, fatty acid hydroxylase superfamily n=1 Tax=Thorsellia anophelis DSM 18579 TaxID=1123402 RepID=A0A1H9YPF7_9GAMM|nr:sterol desaturase family protein [Thorsellia anophelis]SES71024.1 Sterol desaturase/sphingolipid hydroxylase, fatty acid hydroxylase superfamily [Thorsellia anophelis DSM 18579]
MTESSIRLCFFIGSIIIFGLCEAFWPRRTIKTPRYHRWTKNYTFVILSSVIIRFVLPISATTAALIATEQDFGLFNWLTIPYPIQIILGIILLDLLIYTQHLIFHAIPILWRIHQVHHIDESIDSSTALRFHPLEFILSALIKLSFVLLIGIPWIAVICFEIILNSMAIFNHANLKLPLKLDALLRILFVTPDMHRIHHSTHQAEYHSNFGFNLSIWDKLFKTYTANPKESHESMPIGQPDFSNLERNTLWRLMLLPFKRK